MKHEPSYIELMVGIILNLLATLLILKLYLTAYEYAYNVYFKTIFLVDISDQQLLGLGILSIIIATLTSPVDTSAVENDKSYFEKVGLGIFIGIMKPLFLWLTLWVVSFFYL